MPGLRIDFCRSQFLLGLRARDFAAADAAARGSGELHGASPRHGDRSTGAVVQNATVTITNDGTNLSTTRAYGRSRILSAYRPAAEHLHHQGGSGRVSQSPSARTLSGG